MNNVIFERLSFQKLKKKRIYMVSYTNKPDINYKLNNFINMTGVINNIFRQEIS